MPNEFKPEDWKIHNDHKSPVDGDKLNDLYIEKTSSGYDLASPSRVLATTTRTAPPFEFNNVYHADRTWNVHVQNLPAGKNGKGKWHLHGKPPMETDPQDGDFTAQAGSGLGEEPGKAASSAKG